MSKDRSQLLTPLFLKYQSDYEKNPRSRVFAPLAETYRKLGMTDKAMEILSQGIRFHPTYIMGYLGLAFCYFDLKQYTLAYNTLRPFADTSRDNLRLQKLFADVCIEIQSHEEALDTLKYLLFINPRDKEVGLKVSFLEKKIEDQYKPNHQPIYVPEKMFQQEELPTPIHNIFDIDKLSSKPKSSQEDYDDWISVDLTRETKISSSEHNYDDWNLKKVSETFVVDETSTAYNHNIKDVKAELIETTKPSTSNEITFDFNSDDDSETELDNPKSHLSSNTETAPLVTHTLVDLYCGQGHIEKALELLEKILILNPTDQRTLDKIKEIQSLVEVNQTEENELIPLQAEDNLSYYDLSPVVETDSPKAKLTDLSPLTEEEGRKTLMNIFDEQISLPKGLMEDEMVIETKKSTKTRTPSKKKEIVEQKLNLFLKKIQKRALDYQSRI
jgi:tetratricopeptide (TPR) repeat protein